jgi:hypothetical protein
LFEPAETSSPRLYAQQRIGLCFVFDGKALQCEEVGEQAKPSIRSPGKLLKNSECRLLKRSQKHPMPALVPT